MKHPHSHFRIGAAVQVVGTIPAYAGKPIVHQGSTLRIYYIGGRGTLRDPWITTVTDGTHFWYIRPDDLVVMDGCYGCHQDDAPAT